MELRGFCCRAGTRPNTIAQAILYTIREPAKGFVLMPAWLNTALNRMKPLSAMQQKM
jgi:hypothetical protein